MDFIDKILKCLDCGNDFVFTAGEQLFFHDKQFKNDPKRCKQCKIKRVAGTGNGVRTETRTVCSECATETAGTNCIWFAVSPEANSGVNSVDPGIY